MRIFMIALLAAELLIPRPLHAQPSDGLGMWVWSASAFSTPEARRQLVQFSLRHGISHLDVHTKMVLKGENPTLENPGALRDLILLAGQHNITTAILRGDPQMFFSKNHEQTLSELRAIIAFSETLPKDTLFKGLKYDVEPYSTKEWKGKGPAREAVMRDYLTFLREARSVLHQKAPSLWLAVDTPFWWDSDEFFLEFEGEKQRFSEHVQDLTDFIVIMSYWRSAQKVLACVEGERMYAARIKKVVYPALETIQLKHTPHHSFWGVPTEEFWSVVNQLQEAAREDPALGGVMLHSYRGLMGKLHPDVSNTPKAYNAQRGHPVPEGSHFFEPPISY